MQPAGPLMIEHGLIEKKYFSGLDYCQSTVTAEQDRIGDKDEPCDDGIK